VGPPEFSDQLLGCGLSHAHSHPLMEFAARLKSRLSRYRLIRLAKPLCCFAVSAALWFSSPEAELGIS
jgi:hypothetical protein